tara:strand:+ start:1558 stop:1845 length:288 start_codon:yes stop_codon:yes gene_type:complete
MLADKITFLLTNKKIRNLLIIVIVAFSLVGSLRYLDLYEGYSGHIAPEQTSDKSLLDKIDKMTKNTNEKLSDLDKKMDSMKKEDTSDVIIEKEVL